jgi:hypothetical protein
LRFRLPLSQRDIRDHQMFLENLWNENVSNAICLALDSTCVCVGHFHVRARYTGIGSHTNRNMRGLPGPRLYQPLSCASRLQLAQVSRRWTPQFRVLAHCSETIVRYRYRLFCVLGQHEDRGADITLPDMLLFDNGGSGELAISKDLSSGNPEEEEAFRAGD